MFNDDSHNDDNGRVQFGQEHGARVRVGPDRSSGRVQFSSSQGSIYEADANAAGEVHVGGLYSGGQFGSQRNQENTTVRVSAPDLGGYTARTQGGSIITSAAELRPDDLVKIGDIETTVEVARMNGLLGPGALQGGAQAQSDNANQQGANNNDDDTGRQDQQQHLDRNEPMAPEAEAAMIEALDKGGDTVFAALASLQQDGTISRTVIEEYASKLQVEPHEVEHKASVILKGYQDDACRGAARIVGTDEALAHEALHDATRNRRSAFNAAMEKHLETGRTGHYAPLTKDYIASLGDTDPGRVLAAEVGQGVTVSQGHQGEVIVTIDGATYRYEDAVRAGLITVRSGSKR